MSEDMETQVKLAQDRKRAADEVARELRSESRALTDAADFFAQVGGLTHETRMATVEDALRKMSDDRAIRANKVQDLDHTRGLDAEAVEQYLSGLPDPADPGAWSVSPERWPGGRWPDDALCFDRRGESSYEAVRLDAIIQREATA